MTPVARGKGEADAAPFGRCLRAAPGAARCWALFKRRDTPEVFRNGPMYWSCVVTTSKLALGVENTEQAQDPSSALEMRRFPSGRAPEDRITGSQGAACAPRPGRLAVLNRTRREDMVFRQTFFLEGWSEPLPGGTYAVETEEELIEALSFPVYCRVSTTIMRQAGRAGALVQMSAVDPRDLARAKAADGDRTPPGAGHRARSR